MCLRSKFSGGCHKALLDVYPEEVSMFGGYIPYELNGNDAHNEKFQKNCRLEAIKLVCERLGCGNYPTLKSRNPDDKGFDTLAHGINTLNAKLENDKRVAFTDDAGQDEATVRGSLANLYETQKGVIDSELMEGIRSRKDEDLRMFRAQYGVDVWTIDVVSSPEIVDGATTGMQVHVVGPRSLPEVVRTGLGSQELVPWQGESTVPPLILLLHWSDAGGVSTAEHFSLDYTKFKGSKAAPSRTPQKRPVRRKAQRSDSGN